MHDQTDDVLEDIGDRNLTEQGRLKLQRVPEPRSRHVLSRAVAMESPQEKLGEAAEKHRL